MTVLSQLQTMKGRHFIETTDWEEKFLKQERRIDALCWGIAGYASLVFRRFFFYNASQIAQVGA